MTIRTRLAEISDSEAIYRASALCLSAWNAGAKSFWMNSAGWRRSARHARPPSDIQLQWCGLLSSRVRATSRRRQPCRGPPGGRRGRARKPTVGSLACCCAPALSGHIVAAPPSERDELATLHSITSSARASNVGGTVDAERLGRLQVDDELELGRQLDRHFGWLLALEDAAGIDAGLAKLVRKVRSVAHQPAGFGKLAPMVQRGKRMARRQRDELHATADEQRVGTDQECIGPLFTQASQRPRRCRYLCWR